MKLLFAALCSLLVVVSCDKAPQSALRVGVNPWVGYDPLVLAKERQFLDPERVRIVELASNTESQRALRNGLLDAAALTLDEVLRLADAGVALKIIAILDVSQGADAVLAKPGITTPAQLKNQRIALEESALGALILDNLLQSADLHINDVSLIQVEAAQHAEMLFTGRADAVITFEPIKSQLLAKGYKVIFDGQDMQDEIVDVLVVSQDAWSRKNTHLQELLIGWELGKRALTADPQGSASLLAPGTDLTTDQYLLTGQGLVLQSLADDTQKLCGQAEAPIARNTAHLTGTLKRLGLIHHIPDWAALLDCQLAIQAQARLKARS